jgi:sulfide:quinone oxidoreductase
MNKIIQISPQFAVTGALAPGDLAAAARGGFKAVISNLPDGELLSSPVSTHERTLARRAGLGFCHLPVAKGEMAWTRMAEQMLAALRRLPAPVLAHCSSGQRSALAWAAAAAACHRVDDVLGALSAAGFNVFPLREELAGLAGLGGSGPIPAALALAAPRPV